MPRLTIDNREVDMPVGGTILDAARRLGLDIPALCQLDGLEPTTSCMLCLVRIRSTGRIVPSCATLVQDGMQVESETLEIHDLRRTGLELLLSDHAGECMAPCQSACPTHMDVPRMLRAVAAGDLQAAIAIIREDMALPAVLGRLCNDACEKACRRGQIDSPASICLIKRSVAEADLASSSPYLPACRPPSGKKVAIVGTGPSGLSAAYHLLRAGHACTLFDKRDEAGGTLRYATQEDELPRDLLNAEIATIARMGAVIRVRTNIGHDLQIGDLQRDFDAVLLAAGALAADRSVWNGLPLSGGHIQVDPVTHETAAPGVFAAGSAVRARKGVVRSVADGKAVSERIDRYLSGAAVGGPTRPFTVRLGRLPEEELRELLARLEPGAQTSPPPRRAAELTDEEARAEAARCLHCDCASKDGCKLRHYAHLYGAHPGRFRGQRRPLERRLMHADVVYESGKCILCGLCVQIAKAAGEPLGLTFIGRGFDVRVGVPLNRSLDEALRQAARQCAEACPSGAIALHEGVAGGECGSCHGCGQGDDGVSAG